MVTPKIISCSMAANFGPQSYQKRETGGKQDSLETGRPDKNRKRKRLGNAEKGGGGAGGRGGILN